MGRGRRRTCEKRINGAILQRRARMPKKVCQFVRLDKSYSYSSGLTLDLINSANALLRTAAVGSSPEGPTIRVQDASQFVPGAIVLAVTAFELFLNYLIVGGTERNDAEMQEVLDRRTMGKVDLLSQTFGTTCRGRTDLNIVIEVRNEIAHHFPRPGRAPENLPTWFGELQRRGLLITTGRPDGDYELGHKLASFKLAYWASQVVIDAVIDLLQGSSHRTAVTHRYEASNFRSLLNGVPSPRA